MFKYHNTKLAQKHFLISLLRWLRLIFSPHILKERKLFLCVSHKHLRQSMLVLQKRSFSDIFRKFVNERAQGLVASSYDLEVLSENMLASRQKLILIKDFLHCLIFYVAWKLKISHSEKAVQSFAGGYLRTLTVIGICHFQATVITSNNPFKGSPRGHTWESGRSCYIQSGKRGSSKVFF